MKITHLQMFNTTLHRTRDTTTFEIQKEAHDFSFQLSLNPQRLNANQFLTKLENILTLAAAALPLHAHGGEMAGPFNQHGAGCGIGWQ